MLEALPQRPRRTQQLLAVVRERLDPQRADLFGLHQHRATDVLEDGVELVLALGQERVQKARRAGVVHRSSVTASEQAAVLEEDVHQLPQHVVEGLDKLLADVAVIARGLELPLRAERRESDRQASAPAGERHRPERSRPPRRPSRQTRSRCRPRARAGRVGRRLAARSRQADRGQRALADDHGVDELDRDVVRVRARRRRGAEREQPTAAREALGHPVAEAREALGLPREEQAVGLRTPLQQRVEVYRQRALGGGRVGGGRCQAGAPSRERAATPASQSRHASTPSPVRALRSISGTPGCTWSTL